jgi:hypothetical protein
MIDYDNLTEDQLADGRIPNPKRSKLRVLHHGGRGAVICDLDGTIRNDHHRRHFVQKHPKDWAAFYRACVDDTPHPAVTATLDGFANLGYDLIIFTGCCQSMRAETEQWLNFYEISCDSIRMRPIGDHTADTELKKKWLFELFTPGEIANGIVTLVLEDRDRMVAMWRELGIPCFQVAPGAF